MQFDFTDGLTVFATILGAVSLLSSSRVGALKSLVEDLRREVGELRVKLVAVETERDTAKRDLEFYRLKLIEVLDENRALKEQLLKLKDALLQRSRARKTTL